MRFITDTFKYFVTITTGILLIFIIVMLTNEMDSLSFRFIAEIPLMGLITAIITALIQRGEVPLKQFIIRVIVHYLLICLTMSVAAVLFKWVTFTFGGIMSIVLSTAGVYVFTYLATYIMSKKEADELNSALRRKRSER